MQLADSVYANTACTQAQFFMTWGRQIGDPQWDSINTFNKMNKRLRDAYLRIADSTHSSVAAAGPAWKYTIDNYPSINLFSSDGSHPSIAGTYLSACVFYCSTLKKSPVGAPYFAGLDQPTATILQNVAALTVLDSSSVWRLKHHDSLAQVGFSFVEGTNSNDIQFQATGDYISNYSWSFGDDYYSAIQNPNHTFGYNGAFAVELIGTGACGSDTTWQVITINTVDIKESDQDFFKCYQSRENTLTISFETNLFHSNDFTIFAVSGEKIPCQIKSITENEIEISLNYKGLVYLFASDTTNARVQRVFLY
jgi:hypothetical protein